MATLPFYCYSPKSEWPNIRRAESDDEKGLKIRKHYADIYSRDFLGEYQDSEKAYITSLDGRRELDEQFAGTPKRMDAAMVERLAGVGSPLA